MLVLSRKKSQSIIIGDGIKVMVLDVKGDNVKLGLVAPGELRIRRDDMKHEKKEPK